MRPRLPGGKVRRPRAEAISPRCHVQYRHTPYPISDSDLASCVRLGLDLRGDSHGRVVDRRSLSDGLADLRVAGIDSDVRDRRMRRDLSSEPRAVRRHRSCIDRGFVGCELGRGVSGKLFSAYPPSLGVAWNSRDLSGHRSSAASLPCVYPFRG